MASGSQNHCHLEHPASLRPPPNPVHVSSHTPSPAHSFPSPLQWPWQPCPASLLPPTQQALATRIPSSPSLLPEDKGLGRLQTRYPLHSSAPGLGCPTRKYGAVSEGYNTAVECGPVLSSLGELPSFPHPQSLTGHCQGAGREPGGSSL